MDNIDLVSLGGWSLVVASLDISALQLLGLQLAWVVMALVGKALIDRWDPVLFAVSLFVAAIWCFNIAAAVVWWRELKRRNRR